METSIASSTLFRRLKRHPERVGQAQSGGYRTDPNKICEQNILHSIIRAK